MNPDDSASGVQPASPAAPAAPAASVQTPPNGSEAVTNPGSGAPEQLVPFSRFQEVNDKAKTAEEELRKANEELERLRQQPPTPQTPQNGDDDLDPEVVEIVKKSASKLGFVTAEQLAAREAELKLQTQVQQDVRDLEGHYASSGIPYVHQDVLKYATDNNLPITSKAALEAAYRGLNWNKILEAERQRALADNHGSGSGAERPGRSAPQQPQDPNKVEGRNPQERGISRIRAARQKLSI